MFAGFVWLTSNHVLGSGDFWDKSLSVFFFFFFNFEIALVLHGEFQNFQKYTREIYPESPS